MIKINNLSVSYNDQNVLNNISLELPQNGLVAIVGPSGCGKTTLFNCLSGLIKYDGDIVIDGTYINHIPLTKINNFRLKKEKIDEEDSEEYPDDKIQIKKDGK